jgi:toxin ParE1/3/4
MKRLRLSRAAESDLEEAWLYIAEESNPPHADSVLEEIHAKITLLLQYPEAGRERDEFWRGLRSLVALSYVVYHEVGSEMLEVARVHHGARDTKGELRGRAEERGGH